MFDKLDAIEKRYNEVLEELADPDAASDQTKFRKLMKEQSDLNPIVEAFRRYKNDKQTIEDSLELLDMENDEELKELAKEDLSSAKKDLEEAELYSPLDGDYEIEFNGRAPYATASVIYTGDKEEIYSEYFHLDKTDNIALDDTLKVSFDPSQIYENEAAANGYIIDKKKTDVEYKVKAGDIDYYLRTAGDVNDQVLTSLKPSAEKAILDYFDGINEYVSIGEPQYAASYVFMSKYQETWDANNYVDLIYTVQVTSREGAFKTQNIYIPIEFEDVIVEKDGKIPDCYASSPLGETDLKYNLEGWGTNYVKGYKNKTDMERELANDKGNNFNGSVTKGFKDK